MRSLERSWVLVLVLVLALLMALATGNRSFLAWSTCLALFCCCRFCGPGLMCIGSR